VVRVFEVASGRFPPLGLRERPCDRPMLQSATDGTVVAICPDLVKELSLELVPLHGPGHRAGAKPQAPVRLPRIDMVDSAITADGRTVFVLERVQNDAPWRLLAWTRGENAIRSVDLRDLVKASRQDLDPSQLAWLATSRDGEWLAIVHEAKAWILDRHSLALVKAVNLPSTAMFSAFAPNSRTLLVLGRTALKASILRVPVQAGPISQTPLNGVPWGAAPALLVIAPSP